MADTENPTIRERQRVQEGKVKAPERPGLCGEGVDPCGGHGRDRDLRRDAPRRGARGGLVGRGLSMGRPTLSRRKRSKPSGVGVYSRGGRGRRVEREDGCLWWAP